MYIVEIACFFLECECELWNMIIAWALRWGVTSVGKISLLCMVHPIRENISGAG